MGQGREDVSVGLPGNRRKLGWTTKEAVIGKGETGNNETSVKAET
jgi:hypothetical protein